MPQILTENSLFLYFQKKKKILNTTDWGRQAVDIFFQPADGSRFLSARKIIEVSSSNGKNLVICLCIAKNKTGQISYWSAKLQRQNGWQPDGNKFFYFPSHVFPRIFETYSVWFSFWEGRFCSWDVFFLFLFNLWFLKLGFFRIPWLDSRYDVKIRTLECLGQQNMNTLVPLTD